MYVLEDHIAAAIRSPVCLAPIMRKSTQMPHMARVQNTAVEYLRAITGQILNTTSLPGSEVITSMTALAM